MSAYLNKWRVAKTQSLEVLKRIIPARPIILDVGVLTGTYELVTAFPDSHHLLFEPVNAHAQKIHSNYKKWKVGYELVQAAVSNKTGFVNLKTWSIYSENEVSHARMDLDETVSSKPESRDVVKMITLDQHLNTYRNDSPYVLKVDIDGYEHMVLEGASETLMKTCAVIVEARPANFFAINYLMNKSSFHLFDIVDFCYHDNRLAQFDLVFISDYVSRANHMYKGGFNIERWSYYPRDIID